MGLKCSYIISVFLLKRKTILKKETMKKHTIRWLTKNIHLFPNNIATDILKENLKQNPLPPKKAELRTDIDYTIHNIIVDAIDKELGYNLKTKRRFEEIIKGKRLASYFLYKYVKDTLVNKALFIGLDAHATLIYHKNVIKGWLGLEDEETERLVFKIEPIITEAIRKYKKTKKLKSVMKIDKKTDKILESYKSVKEAAEKNNLKSDTIRDVCNKRVRTGGYIVKTTGGFKWEWE